MEDQFSSYKIGTYYHSLALLGTNLNESKVQEILEEPKYSKIFLCLDNDATMHAVKLQLKWRNKLPDLQVRGLATDIKDMNDDDFERFRNSLLL